MFFSTNLLAAASFAATVSAGLVQDFAPSSPQPYVIPNMKGKATNFGGSIIRTLVSNDSSAGSMSLVSVSSQTGPMGPIHFHAQAETFYVLKGMVQLFHNENAARELSANDFAYLAVGNNHTYRTEDLDWQMSLCMTPSGADGFFESVGVPYNSSNASPFDPENTVQLDLQKALAEAPKYGLTPALANKINMDMTNGTTEDGIDSWHRGPQTLPDNDSEAYFVSSNRGPKFLQRDLGQVVAQLATGTQTGGRMTAGTVAVKPGSSAGGDVRKYASDQAFQVTEGQLMLRIANETVPLIYGDLAFLPGGTAFQYWSTVGFTKFVAWSAGTDGLVSDLVKGAEQWNYGVWPAN